MVLLLLLIMMVSGWRF